jgi:hypothetical protein
MSAHHTDSALRKNFASQMQKLALLLHLYTMFRIPLLTCQPILPDLRDNTPALNKLCGDRSNPTGNVHKPSLAAATFPRQLEITAYNRVASLRRLRLYMQRIERDLANNDRSQALATCLS